MICLGKVSEHFSRATKEKVLLPAFVQGLGDSFAPGRQHSLSALVREACHTAAPRGPTPRAREQTTPPLPPCCGAAVLLAHGMLAHLPRLTDARSSRTCAGVSDRALRARDVRLERAAEGGAAYA